MRSPIFLLCRILMAGRDRGWVSYAMTLTGLFFSKPWSSYVPRKSTSACLICRSARDHNLVLPKTSGAGLFCSASPDQSRLNLRTCVYSRYAGWDFEAMAAF